MQANMSADVNFLMEDILLVTIYDFDSRILQILRWQMIGLIHTISLIKLHANDTAHRYKNLKTRIDIVEYLFCDISGA